MLRREGRLISADSVIAELAPDISLLPGEDAPVRGARLGSDGESNVLIAAARQGARLASYSNDPRGLVPIVASSQDVIYISGLDVSNPGAGTVLANWLLSLECRPTVIFDPGSTAGEIEEPVLKTIMSATSVLSLSRSVAGAIAEVDATLMDPAAVVEILRNLVHAGVAIILRDGKLGCWVNSAEGDSVVHLPAPVVEVVDVTGAGDAHSGALASALLEGLDLFQAAARANAVAAMVVSRSGSSSSPTLAELAEFFVE